MERATLGPSLLSKSLKVGVVELECGVSQEKPSLLKQERVAVPVSVGSGVWY